LVLVNESGQEQKVSSRPSDAVALAVRVEAPILATNELFEEAGISIPEQGEDEIEKFKEFLDEISPEDFA
jgi:bifunctional DNase/RNase